MWQEEERESLPGLLAWTPRMDTAGGRESSTGHFASTGGDQIHREPHRAPSRWPGLPCSRPPQICVLMS